MSTLAVYPGSFDPLTNGHVDIIARGTRLFDRIIVAILMNAEKAPMFSTDERVEIAREVFADQRNVEVDTFDGLLVDYVERRRRSTVAVTFIVGDEAIRVVRSASFMLSWPALSRAGVPRRAPAPGPAPVRRAKRLP